MKGQIARTLHLAMLMCLIWALLIGLMIFIDRVILRVNIGSPIVRAVFRNGTSFLLLAILLYFWKWVTQWYYNRYVAKGRR